VFGSDAWTDEEFEDTIRTFVCGPVYTLNKAMPLLEKAVQLNGSASVINISSVAGTHPIPNGAVPYSMTKAAIDALSKGAAVELAAKGIRVNSVAPGITQSEFMSSTGRSDADVKAFAQKQASLIPAHRIGTPADIANAVRTNG
jgi:NAD(P)-dependent dehydrogenase (short-subunit alcohol dehydrogenase family)